MAENNAYKLKLFQDETARGLARLYEAGYLPNDHMGEVSLRDAESGLVFISIKPGTFYIADPSEYHGSDIAVATLDGEPVTTVTPPNERLALHLAVYKARPDVHAILHTYPVWSSLFSERGESIPYVLAEQIEASTAVECVTAEPSMDEAYFDEVIRHLKQEKYVLLHNFGSLAVGDNIDNAFNYLAWMESVTRKITLASMIGELHTIG